MGLCVRYKHVVQYVQYVPVLIKAHIECASLVRYLLIPSCEDISIWLYTYRTAIMMVLPKSSVFLSTAVPYYSLSLLTLCALVSTQWKYQTGGFKHFTMILSTLPLSSM